AGPLRAQLAHLKSDRLLGWERGTKTIRIPPLRSESVDFLRGGPSIRPRKKWGLLGANGFSNLFREYLNRSPRVAAFFWRRIEGRVFLSTLPSQGEGGQGLKGNYQVLTRW